MQSKKSPSPWDERIIEELRNAEAARYAKKLEFVNNEEAFVIPLDMQKHMRANYAEYLHHEIKKFPWPPEDYCLVLTTRREKKMQCFMTAEEKQPWMNDCVVYLSNAESAKVAEANLDKRKTSIHWLYWIAIARTTVHATDQMVYSVLAIPQNAHLYPLVDRIPLRFANELKQEIESLLTEYAAIWRDLETKGLVTPLSKYNARRLQAK